MMLLTVIVHVLDMAVKYHFNPSGLFHCNWLLEIKISGNLSAVRCMLGN